ncbi:hypothetical protein C8R46DRAFT_1094966 [Mycena filopes]|nr:hypothetical protein C8R46DRAFT_1094966 [Mycena filopes]
MLPSSPAPSSGVSSRLGPFWQGMHDDVSNGERKLDKVTDTASVVVDGASSDEGLAGLAKGAAEDPGLQAAGKAIGKAIVEGVPGFMRLLETLTDVHPFLKAVYLPFKQIYYQETQRRDNDQKRTKLYDTMKDAILVLLELEHVRKDDTRTVPTGERMLSRLAVICNELEQEIRDCYNVVDAQKRRSLAIKYLKAASWNEKLVTYVALFQRRRDELQIALSLKTVMTVEEMNSNVKEIKDTMMQMFATMISPQERDIGRWIEQNGGKDVVLASEKKCAELIRYEARLTPSSGQAVPRPANDDPKTEARAVANLKKEYREDVQLIIQENLESFSRGFKMGLDNLEKDLGKKIQHQGDRVIHHLMGGPHRRIKDWMIFHVWKDQGWKGSAKTRSLVLAIRDYFVERVEHEHNKLAPPEHGLTLQRPISPFPSQRPRSPFPRDDEDDEDTYDPAADLSVPLPDNWMMAYLQVKRLHYLQQAMDPDCSGFTTISEVNAFTNARPLDWSLPRWISYWAIGWQISATKYCGQIEELFSQIFLLTKKISMQRPGNKKYVHDYIDYTWEYVTALTSSIDRYDSPSLTLEEKFADYAESQEKEIKEALETIQYKIDNNDTVMAILHGKPIEQRVFVLLALLLKRHLAKIHLCLKQDIDERELVDSLTSIAVVINAAYSRFRDLKDYFLHQRVDLKQTFEWYSCGLFKNYHDWGAISKANYFRASDMTTWSAGNIIHELDPSELADVLTYPDQPGATKTRPPSPDTIPAPSTLVVPETSNPGATPSVFSAECNFDVLINVYSTETSSVASPSTDKMPAENNSTRSKPSAAEASLTGMWHGWHWTETEKPYLSMISFELKPGGKLTGSENKTEISGNGVTFAALAWTLAGTMDSTNQPSGSMAVDFVRTFVADGVRVQYKGTFLVDREMIHGTFERTAVKGWFMFKKVPTSLFLCSRPYAAILNPRELWTFACGAVLRQVRRRKFTLAYLSERMADVRRMMELISTEDNNRDSDAEFVEFSKLAGRFSIEQLAELWTFVLSRRTAAETSITGTWYGWHWTDTQNPLWAMENLTLGFQSQTEPLSGVRGEGIKASGQSWSLIGSMILSGRLMGSWEVKFDSWEDDGTWTRYSGTFLPKRQLISGTFDRAGTGEHGRFLFKMVPRSVVMCTRPLVAELDVRQRWLFAYDAVKADQRRQKATRQYLFERVTTIRRVMEFIWKLVLTGPEADEYSKLLKTFSAEEISEVWKLYQWYYRVDVLHPYAYCDVCGDHMKRTRVVCLECSNAEKATDTVDLCTKLTCIASSNLPKRTDVTHSSSHLMMKIRDYFLLKDYFMFKQQALEALETARALYQEPTEQNNSITVTISAAGTTTQGQTENAAQTPDHAPKCTICNEHIKTPCWYCIECQVNDVESLNTWVCDTCDKKTDDMYPWDFLKRHQAQMREGKKHTVLHRLVRLPHPSSADDKKHGEKLDWEHLRQDMKALITEGHVDKEMKEVKSRLDKMESRLEQMDSRLEQLVNFLTKQVPETK